MEDAGSQIRWPERTGVTRGHQRGASPLLQPLWHSGQGFDLSSSFQASLGFFYLWSTCPLGNTESPRATVRHRHTHTHTHTHTHVYTHTFSSGSLHSFRFSSLSLLPSFHNTHTMWLTFWCVLCRMRGCLVHGAILILHTGTHCLRPYIRLILANAFLTHVPWQE